MDLQTWLTLGGLVLTLGSMLGGMLWALGRSIQTQFTTLTKSQTENYHSIDVRLTGIETTVSPYAQHISTLQKQQSDNIIKITKLEGMEDKIARLERQVENLQKK